MVPKAEIPRSSFRMQKGYKTTFDAGKLIPFYVDEVLPGDTFSVDTAGLVRMTTPIFPVMDNAYLDVYYFFVPNRIVWEHWKEFMGENTTGAWEQKTEYSVPQLYLAGAIQVDNIALEPAKIGTVPEEGSILDYMGIPTKCNRKAAANIVTGKQIGRAHV